MVNENNDSFFMSIDKLLMDPFERMILEGKLEPDNVEKPFKETIVKLVPLLAPVALEGIKKQVPFIIENNKTACSLAEKSIYEYWKEPLDLIEAFLQISLECSVCINAELRLESKEADRFIIDALTRLHGQACLIAKEMLLLMRNGYADGAYARWRSLYEVTVVASFIYKFGNELAEKYLNHNVIESYKALEGYQKWAVKLKLSLIPEGEVNLIRKERNRLLSKYGEEFRNNYGWAASVLGSDSPSFEDIEKKAGLNHYRPYYKLASHHIHSNPKCILFKLGLSSSNGDILASYSNLGLAEPGQGLVISLNLINCIILSLKKTLTTCVIMSAMNQWVGEICNKLIEAHSRASVR